MKNIFISILIIFFCGCSEKVQCQLSNVDSALFKLKTHPQQDAQRIHLLIKTAKVVDQVSPDSSMHFILLAKELAIKLNNPIEMIRTFSASSFFYSRSGNYPLAMKDCIAALKIADIIKNDSAILELNVTLGEIYLNTGENVKALNYFKNAYPLAKSAKNYNTWANIMLDLGDVYNELNKWDTSLTCLKEADSIANFLEPSIKYDLLQALYYVEVKVLIHLNKINEAEVVVKRFKELNEKFKFTNSIDVSQFSHAAAELAFVKKDFKSAFELSQITYTEALKANIDRNRLEALFFEYKSSKALNLSSSLLYFEQYHNLYDTLFNKEKNIQETDLQITYETEKKEQQIKFLNIQNEKQTRNLWTLGILLSGVLVLLGLIFRQKKSIQNQNKKISEQSNKLKLLMKELHHRVKNNLQIVSSLLSLQSFRIKDKAAANAVKEGQHRIEAMSLIHQRLYTNDNITEVNIKEFITDISESLMQAYGYDKNNFVLNLKIENELMDVDKAIPLSLIINELVTNAFKYAYADTAKPQLSITLTKVQNDMQLFIADNGKGMDMEAWQNNEGYGKELVKTFTKQLDGEIAVTVDNGTTFKITFPAILHNN